MMRSLALTRKQPRQNMKRIALSILPLLAVSAQADPLPSKTQMLSRLDADGTADGGDGECAQLPRLAIPKTCPSGVDLHSLHFRPASWPA
ncbi:hypothetical protein EME01_59750 [Sinorhizobium meliloti]|nr:hypothetical protein EME01_59750 [Sinorhizobium meliloti]